MEIKDRLTELRNERGLTMDMFVFDINNKFEININKGLVSRWENGINEPSLRYAAYMAQYYNVSLDYLIGLTDVRTPARLLAYAKGMSKAKEIPRLEGKYQHTTFAAHKISNPSDKLINRRKNES